MVITFNASPRLINFGLFLGRVGPVNKGGGDDKPPVNRVVPKRDGA